VKGWLLAAAFVICGCGPDCVPSADIQLTVVATGGVDVSQIARLHVFMSINGAPMRSIDIAPSKSLDKPATLLLRPDPPPAMTYNVAFTVEALSASDALVAVGTAGGDVVSNGCNRLEARLTGFGEGVDAGMGFDGILTQPDLFTADLAGCTAGGTHDEDGDGRTDVCDLCPADADPNVTDADNDGLPDACDPDIAKPGNKGLYFDPFVVDLGQWSGGYPISNDFLNLDTNGPNAMVSTNGLTQLPSNARVEGNVFMRGLYVDSNPNSDAGVYLGNSASPGAPTAMGMLCLMAFDQQQNMGTLQLQPVVDGVEQVATTVPFNFQTGVRYRLQLTRRGTAYVCDASASGIPTTTVNASFNQAPSGVQFMALHAMNMEAHFHSVFAATTIP
jgi:hypothetical protein